MRGTMPMEENRDKPSAGGRDPLVTTKPHRRRYFQLTDFAARSLRIRRLLHTHGIVSRARCVAHPFWPEASCRSRLYARRKHVGPRQARNDNADQQKAQPILPGKKTPIHVTAVTQS